MTDIPILAGRVWHVAVTKPLPTSRGIAVAALHRRGYSALLPMCREEIVRGGRRVVVEGPMFGRYLFVGVAPDQDSWGIRLVPGIQHATLDAKRRPVTIAVPVLEAIVERMIAGGGVVDLRPTPVTKGSGFVEGQAVRVLSGPFEGFNGLFEADEGERCRVLVSLFGRQTVARVPARGIAAT